jgi:hypothetical protein
VSATAPKLSRPQIRDEFTEHAWDAPNDSWRSALRKIGRALGLVDARLKPVNSRASTILKECRTAFRKEARCAKKIQSRITRLARKQAKLDDPNDRIIRNSLFDILSRYPHDYRKDGEKEVHSYLCRRCALTVRLNGLRNQIQALIRDVKETIGEMLDD